MRHDQERERPVYFQWQILEWAMPLERQKAVGLKTQPEIGDELPVVPPLSSTPSSDGLSEVLPPERTESFGRRTPQFRAQKTADYSLQDARDRRLGGAGELAVLKKEVDRLSRAGRSDLAAKIIHVSKIEGDGAGYDIKSFHEDGSIKYIEVKTTRGGKSTPFFMSINEILFSKVHAEKYALYRVFDFDVITQTGKVFELSGNIENGAHLEAINFRVKM